jgi:hypothetical protein
MIFVYHKISQYFYDDFNLSFQILVLIKMNSFSCVYFFHLEIKQYMLKLIEKQTFI